MRRTPNFATNSVLDFNVDFISNSVFNSVPNFVSNSLSNSALDSVPNFVSNSISNSALDLVPNFFSNSILDLVPSFFSNSVSNLASNFDSSSVISSVYDFVAPDLTLNLDSDFGSNCILGFNIAPDFTSNSIFDLVPDFISVPIINPPAVDSSAVSESTKLSAEFFSPEFSDFYPVEGGVYHRFVADGGGRVRKKTGCGRRICGSCFIETRSWNERIPFVNLELQSEWVNEFLNMVSRQDENSEAVEVMAVQK